PSGQNKRSWRIGEEAAEKVEFPPNFVMPTIKPYNGHSDPAAVMNLFVNTLSPFKLGEATILHMFPRYISESTFNWYHAKNVWEH
ncbi:hypothetical protein PJN12_29005, partial [Mycobacterium kansasii]